MKNIELYKEMVVAVKNETGVEEYEIKKWSVATNLQHISNDVATE